MLLRSCNLKVGMVGVQSQSILACMKCCLAKYDSSTEVGAYDLQPAAKRARKGRKQAASTNLVTDASKTPAEPAEDRLRIGTKRLAAIKNILSYCTEKSYKLLEMHLAWVGDYSLSAVNNTTLV